MTPDRWTRRVSLVLAALSLLLSGCTTYVATHVTAFSDWSGDDASRTYAFTRTPRQENSIEQSTYEGLVANELASHAFRRVDEAQAQYLVGLSYSSRREIVNVAQPAYFYNPWPGPYWRGQIDPWGPFGPYPGGYVDSSYAEYTHMLGLRITARATGREVYSVTARNVGEDPSLVLADALSGAQRAGDFPLGNGVTRTVRIPVDQNGGAASTRWPAWRRRLAASAPKVVQ